MNKDEKRTATAKDLEQPSIGNSERDMDLVHQVEKTLDAGQEQLTRSARLQIPQMQANDQLAILKRFVEASSLGYGFTDLDGNIIYTNAALSRILGWVNPEDGLGINIATYYPEDIRPEQQLIPPTVISEGQWVGELPLLSLDGKVNATNQHITLIRNDKGNPLCLSYVITGITEQKRVVETLRESQAMLQSMLDSSPLATTVSDLAGRVIDCNVAAVQIYGFETKADLIGRETIEFIAPEDQEKIITTLGQITEGKGVASTECTIIARDGQRRSVEISASAIPGPSGEPVAFIGMGKDITERKQAEEELRMHRDHLKELVDVNTAELRAINENLEEEIAEREQVEEELQQKEQYFRALIENSSDAIIIMDAQGELVYQSPSFERVMGFKPGDTDIRNPLETVHPEHFDHTMHNFMHVAQKPGSIIHHETLALHKDGSWRNLEIISHNLLDNLAVRGIVSNLRDITDRKEAEEARNRLNEELQENNAQLEEEISERRRTEEALLLEKNFSEAIINSLPGAFYLFDDKGRFVRWNGNFEKVTGYSSDAIGQMNPVDFFQEAEQPIVAEAILEALEKGESSVEANFLNKAEQLIPYYFTGARLDVDCVPHVIGMGIDITDRKRMEEQLKGTLSELERSNRELEQFAYVASHDLQEPLRKIRAFGDRLKTTYAGIDNEKGQDYLNRMLSASERAQALIESLLTFSRITTRAHDFDRVNLNEVAQAVISDMETTIQRTGAHIEVSELPTIDAEPVHMRQLLQNLIGNGIKFHREDEKPIVKIYSGAGRNGYCQILVEDNGIGFDEKYTDRIFTIFQRLHGRLEYEGTGIGLAITRKITEYHGGNITATSTTGQGSTFIVTLPVNQNKRGTN